ncbi:MAG TPA: hypothetical protein VFA50_09875 [Stellaceae bacterium]|nr:hypothetical protein [Stellaceae bacterium]
MRPNGVKLSRLHQAALYGAFAVLFASGLAWSILHDGVPVLGGGDGGESAIEPLLLSIHGAAAMAALLVLGSLLPQHIKWAWKGRMNRSTGGLMLTTQALLVVTGYALYYAGDDGMRALASRLHLVLGLGFPALLVWHIREGRRRAALQKAASRAGRDSPFPPPPLRVDLPQRLTTSAAPLRDRCSR